MIKLLKKLIVGFCSSLALTGFNAHAETVYAYSKDTGTLYSYDTLINTPPPIIIGSISPTFMTQLTDTRANDVDITYFGGYIYGLVSGFNSTTALFRIDPITGLEDSTYGTGGIQIVKHLDGSNLTNFAAEGITNNGNELVIAFATDANNMASTELARVNSNTGQMIGVNSDTRNSPSQSGISAGVQARDIDGMGRCGERIVNVNTENGNIVNIRDMGPMSSPYYEPMATMVDANNKPFFADVAFLGSTKLVVAGSIGTNSGQLHFYDVSVNGSATLTSSVPVTGDSVFAVASNGEANCTIPIIKSPITPDFQCYDLMDHEQDTYSANLSKTIIDQFASTNVRIGHAVSLCNPVDINGTAKPETEDHLVCYEIHSESTATPKFNVEVINQIETNQLVTGHADEICLVSTKRHL